MPRAPRICKNPNCDTRGPSAYCPQHKPQGWQTTTRGGSTRASRAMRDVVLERDPICRCPGCRACTPGGCTRTSREADHILNDAAGGAYELDNLRGTCVPCHKVKTQTEAARGRGPSPRG